MFTLSLMSDSDVVDCGFVFSVDVFDHRIVFFSHHFNLKLQLIDFMSIIYNSIFVDNPFRAGTDLFALSLMSDSDVIDYGFMLDVNVLNGGVVLFDHYLNAKFQLLDHHQSNLLWAFNHYILIDDFGIRSYFFRLFLMVDSDVVDCGFVFDVDIFDRLSVFFDQHFNLKLQLFDFMFVIYNSIFVDNPF